MPEIRVLIADDQQLIRDGIASLLTLNEQIKVVGTAENGRKCVKMASELSPDVILMDIRMPVMDGIAATEELYRLGKSAKILMLTTFDDEEYIVKSLQAGAVGYLMKDIPIEDLIRGIIQVHNGTFQMASSVMGTLIGRIDSSPANETPRNWEMEQLWNNLNNREQDVLRLLGTGATNKEIAESLYLSEGTVKNYVSDILATLDLRDRTQAAILAIKNGWLPESE